MSFSGRLCLAILLCGATARLWAMPVALEYRLHCSGCHGVDGHGLPANGIPDLSEAGRWAGTPEGRAYLVQVPGISASTIDNPTAARILNWALQQFSAKELPVDFKAFTPEEIASERTGIATDANRRRQALLSAQSPDQ